MSQVVSSLHLLKEVAQRYRRYLHTTFYFRDPELRTSFAEALESANLVKGPYLEATPAFSRGLTPRQLFSELLGREPSEDFLYSIHGDRPLYSHQEAAIRRVAMGRNVIIATGTGSGKTESFLLPILLHLYREFEQGKLCPGVRALILYPMNALANDQRDRLGEICRRLAESGSPFQFTFGQYIGETPENENDSARRAQDYLRNRLPGELVLRSEMRETPPHILLTNYSMLEYLLLRPYDSPLFDKERAHWWTFFVLDEAHQYRGTRGIEMAMLLRRLKRRIEEGDTGGPFRCIATSATLLGGQGNRHAAANFAASLFGEPFDAEDVIVGDTEPVPNEGGSYKLSPNDYRLLLDALSEQPTGSSRLAELADKLGVEMHQDNDVAVQAGVILNSDERAISLRQLITGEARPVNEIAKRVFPDVPENEQVYALDILVEVLMRARDPSSKVKDTKARPPLLAARYHFFLRSLEGAFISYLPKRRILLDRSTVDGSGTFEVALCRECGQHYLVGKIDGTRRRGKLVEAIRDPSHPDFGATFFLPLEEPIGSRREEEEGDGHEGRQVYHLCRPGPLIPEIMQQKVRGLQYCS